MCARVYCNFCGEECFQCVKFFVQLRVASTPFVRPSCLPGRCAHPYRVGPRCHMSQCAPAHGQYLSFSSSSSSLWWVSQWAPGQSLRNWWYWTSVRMAGHPGPAQGQPGVRAAAAQNHCPSSWVSCSCSVAHWPQSWPQKSLQVLSHQQWPPVTSPNAAHGPALHISSPDHPSLRKKSLVLLLVLSLCITQFASLSTSRHRTTKTLSW